MVGVHDDRVGALVEAALRPQLAGARLAREHVVGRDDHGPVAGQQADVQRLDREPLEVHDVGVAGRAAVAQHVRHVLGQLGRLAHARSRAAGGEPVEALVDRVALGGWDVPIGKRLVTRVTSWPARASAALNERS